MQVKACRLHHFRSGPDCCDRHPSLGRIRAKQRAAAVPAFAAAGAGQAAHQFSAKRPAQRPQEPPPQVAISVQSNLVTVDAIVTDQDGNLVTGLKRENFRVLDDGQPQQVTNFAPTDAPITVVILMEYSSTYWGYYQGYFGYKAQYLGGRFSASFEAAGLGGAEDFRPSHHAPGRFHPG